MLYRLIKVYCLRCNEYLVMTDTPKAPKDTWSIQEHQRFRIFIRSYSDLAAVDSPKEYSNNILEAHLIFNKFKKKYG